MRQVLVRQSTLVLTMHPEAYTPPKHGRSLSNSSYNLRCLELNDCFVRHFFCQPLYKYRPEEESSAGHGDPNDYFDAVQLCLTHSVLSTQSFSSLSMSSRSTYDPLNVYGWQSDDSFRTLYHVSLASDETFGARWTLPALSLDLYNLLHIRNFWNRHFTSRDENTYYEMACKLERLGRGPKSWGERLRPDEDKTNISERWIGNYSCMHDFREVKNLAENMQSCAEDWHPVDPIVSTLSIHCRLADLRYFR